MDRSTCILIYSEKSATCGEIIDRLKSLPFDLPRVTGLAFLSIDKKAISDWYKNVLKVRYIPALYVRYFGEKDARILQGKRAVMQWIDAICDALNFDKEVGGGGAAAAAVEKDYDASRMEHVTRLDTTPKVRKSVAELAKDMMRDRELSVK